MQAKKSLGQNWLISESARQTIIETADLSPVDMVLEIGPGQGFLTESLLTRAGKVVAIEKDDRLIGPLQSKFQNEIADQKLTLIHGDALGHPMSKLLGDKFKLVSNIPYYLTGQILRHFLEAEIQPELMVLMLQEEVAEHIVAKNGRESLLSISVKVYGEPELIAKVPAVCFRPQPRVNSAILLIKNISRDRFRHLDTRCPSAFFDLLKRGFAHKRKLLKNNLGYSTELLGQAKIDPRARAENLSLAQWLHLTTPITTSKKP